MKASSQPIPFQPVTLSFRFETQDELDSFGSLFNTAPVASAVGRDMARVIYTEVQLFGGDVVKRVDGIIDALKADPIMSAISRTQLWRAAAKAWNTSIAGKSGFAGAPDSTKFEDFFSRFFNAL